VSIQNEPQSMVKVPCLIELLGRSAVAQPELCGRSAGTNRIPPRNAHEGLDYGMVAPAM
jgi:hypothetical protein